MEEELRDRYLLTVKHACRALDVPRSRLYLLMESEPELKPLKIGKSVRLRADRVRDWIDRKASEQALAGPDEAA